jgi:hypothetical protein
VDRRPEGGSRRTGYVLGFGFTAFLLGGMTLIMVLVILPRRYVLNAGLRESGISFPSEAAPFIPPQEVRREAPLPPPPPPDTEMAPRGAGEVFWERVEPLLRGEGLPMPCPCSVSTWRRIRRIKGCSGSMPSR